jgi:hypothetical protein
MGMAGQGLPAAARPPGKSRWIACVLALACIASNLQPAHAVIMGTASSLGGHTVQLHDRAGRLKCSGVAIDRSIVVTAAHCGGLPSVIADGHSVTVASVIRGSVVTESGLRVSVSGDAVFLRLRAPLPNSVGAITIGSPGGDRYTIAGYGTVDETNRGGGALHEATLVHAGRFVLVDPARKGRLSASACFGDSGGPVVSGGQLVGVITRASYPRVPNACGYYTHYAPVIVSGRAAAATTGSGGAVLPSVTPRTPPVRHR